MTDAGLSAILQQKIVVTGHSSIRHPESHIGTSTGSNPILAIDGNSAGHWLRNGRTVITSRDLLNDGEIRALREVSVPAVDLLLSQITGVQGDLATHTAIAPHEVPVVDRNVLIDWLHEHLLLDRSLSLLESLGVEWVNRVTRTRWVPTGHDSVTVGTLLEELSPWLMNGAGLPPSESGGSCVPFSTRARSVAARWIELPDRLKFSVWRVPKGRVVAPLLSLEWSRHAVDLKRLTAAGFRPTIVPLDVSYRNRYSKAPKVASKYGHRVLMRGEINPSALVSATEIMRTRAVGWQTGLLQGHSESLDRAHRTLSAALPFLIGRWAAMSADWQSWKRLWHLRQPAAVVVVRSTTSSILPLHAALAAGVGAVSLPHGMVEREMPLPGHPDVFHVTPFPVSTQAAASGWVYCPDAVLEREYVRADRPAPAGLGNVRRVVLVLVDQMGVHFSGALRTIKMVEDFLAFANEHMEFDFVIKDHPSGPVIGPLCRRRVTENIVVAAADADLAALIDVCSSVVFLDYEGSAVLHVHRSGRPSVHLEMDSRTRDRASSFSPQWRQVSRSPTVRTLAGLGRFLEGIPFSAGDGHGASATSQGSVASDGPTIEEIVGRATRTRRSAYRVG